jgi:hypothetical protein
MTDSQVRLGVGMSMVLLVLAALLYFAPQKSEEPVDEAATEAVWSFAEDDVERLTVHAAGYDLVLARSDDGWSVEEPYQDRAETWPVRSLVADLARVKKATPIHSTNADNFGVGVQPEATIEVELKDGRKLPLTIGKPTPVGGKTYAKLSSGAIVALGVDIHDRLLDDPASFRDHHLVKFDPKQVAGVRIESDLGTLDLRREGAAWWSEGFTRADAQKVEELVLSLLDLRFEVFAPVDLLAQMPKPAFTATIRMASGDPIVVRFDVPSDQGTLAAVEAGPVGFVNTGAVAFLRQGPKDVGDAEAFAFDPSTVEALAVSLGGQVWSLKRSGNGWTRDGKDEPKGAEALAALDRAKIAYRREPVPPVGAVWGTVTATVGEVTQVVECGGPLEDKRICRDRAGGATYLVPQAQLDAIARVFE